MHLLIDGYNLLYATGLLGRGIGPGGLERSRMALVNFLAASLEPAELAQTTVIFDAASHGRNARANTPPGLPSVLNSHGLTIRFAVGYENADALIEELIRAEPAPRRLVVVSGDHRIQAAARRRKATPIDSETWYDDVVRRRRERRGVRGSTGGTPVPPDRPSGSLMEEEVAYWLRQFDVDKPSPDEAPGSNDVFPPGYGEDLLEGEP
jgi:predicted RNA-binding protein with PIN domain